MLILLSHEESWQGPCHPSLEGKEQSQHSSMLTTTGHQIHALVNLKLLLNYQILGEGMLAI